MTKDDLKEYTSIKRELKQIQFKLKELEERKTSIKSMVISDMNVQTSHNNNSIEDLLIKIEECIEEYNKKEIELYNKQLEIEKCINSLEPTERIIARSRYIEGKTFEQISVDLNYSWRHTIRIHGKILQKI
jgi:DNA-directed RNA polymerase specialized sigma subunit|nr:MAG TPA: Protein of unknown function (DUF722) [Caudoviricetes sp.]